MDMDKGTFVCLVLTENTRRFPSELIYFLCNLGGEVSGWSSLRSKVRGLKRVEKLFDLISLFND